MSKYGSPMLTVSVSFASIPLLSHKLCRLGIGNLSFIKILFSCLTNIFLLNFKQTGPFLSQSVGFCLKATDYSSVASSASFSFLVFAFALSFTFSMISSTALVTAISLFIDSLSASPMYSFNLSASIPY